MTRVVKEEMMIGFIGGSGLYDLDSIDDVVEKKIETPWGMPSDRILMGRIGEIRVAFLPRHGMRHDIPPHEVNYRANIDALKRVGVTDVISISACGSLRENLSPGKFVLVTQYIDQTKSRANSFFGTGCVAHVSMADPVCQRLVDTLEAGCRHSDIDYQRGGTYLAIDGPQFSSRAESELYRQWGCDVIGMTNMPEAKLAREAELPYASVAMVTDYDCWRANSDDVEVHHVLQIMRDNVRQAKILIKNIVPLFARERHTSPQNIETILDRSIVTAPEARDPAALARIDAITRRLRNE